MSDDRIFFDTEFMEDGQVILPLSIGLVGESGRGLYVVVTDANRDLANEWVVANVLPHIDCDPVGAETLRLPHHRIGAALIEWVQRITDAPEFWADYCSYDWIVLCQFFGMMIDLPTGWPMFCRDVQQERHRLGVTDLPLGDDDHNAFQDALTTRERWRVLCGLSS